MTNLSKNDFPPAKQQLVKTIQQQEDQKSAIQFDVDSDTDDEPDDNSNLMLESEMSGIDEEYDEDADEDDEIQATIGEDVQENVNIQDSAQKIHSNRPSTAHSKF